MKKLFSLTFLILLVGCANQLNDATYGRYTDAGDLALERGDYVQAEIAYARAAQNVDWGRLGPAAKSGSLFNLANAKIRLKKYAEVRAAALGVAGDRKEGKWRAGITHAEEEYRIGYGLS
ncbi:MAG: hypothetical protein QM715_01220 [Nibricoccus sp.]